MGYHINFDPDRLKEKIKNPRVRTYSHERLRIYCDKYVPFRTGRLSRDVRVTEEGVHYVAPYAASCYYGNFNFRKDHHPDATNRWAEFMMINEGDRYVNEIRRYIIQQL